MQALSSRKYMKSPRLVFLALGNMLRKGSKMLLSSRVWLDSNIKRPEASVFLFIAYWKMGLKAVEKPAFILVSLFGEIVGNPIRLVFSTGCSWYNDFPQQEIGVKLYPIKMLIYHCKSIKKDSVKVIFMP